MPTKKRTARGYMLDESCAIINLISENIKRDYLINYDFHKPEDWYPVYTKQKMAALDKRITAFIKYLELYVKPYDKDEIDVAVAYFTSGIISNAIDYETLKIKDDQGVYNELNHKRDERKSFYNVLYCFEGNLSYFSDRWCYSRVFAFKMYWSFVKSKFKTYQYFLENN
jgi:hypothetical protein